MNRSPLASAALVDNVAYPANGDPSETRLEILHFKDDVYELRIPGAVSTLVGGHEFTNLAEAFIRFRERSSVRKGQNIVEKV